MRHDPENVYAYDIESMNDDKRGYNGLDPSRSYVTEIAVATDTSINGGGEVFTGNEAKILADFARFVRSLKPGLMVGWNNTFFDNPFLDYRSALVLPGGVHDLGMSLKPEPSLSPKYDPLPTATTPTNPNGGWSAQFAAADGGLHASLDVAPYFKEFAEEQGIKWGLKPVCEARGIDMFEIPDGFVDADDFRTRLHDATPEQRKAYVLSDGHGARELGLDILTAS